MAGLIPQSFIDDLVARADIVEIINARVPLKRAGREYRACCPFHQEKTPSFWVSPIKQFYHCFGCGAHGTVLAFLMNYDRLPFVEAVEELAQRLGLEVPREQSGSPAPQAISDDLYTQMGKVATFYQEQLLATERAREYAKKRGLTREIATQFGIGYAPDSWNEVLKRFGASEESRQKLLETGLIIARDSGEGHYDRFRDRLMFPIRDARGRVIAFGGRVLDAGEPKYLNSPETPLFHKGRELYGLYEVRQNRAPLMRLMIVEGYMDVVRLHQSGITYAVATLGTATTPEHLKRAFRLVREIVFCFDGDKAGRAAAWRALNNALPEATAGRELKFLFLPDGEDPDSLVGKEGKEAFEARLAGALPLSEYLVQHLAGAIDISHADGKARFVAEARPLLERMPEGPYRELLLDRLAEAIGVSAERFLKIVGPMTTPDSSIPAPAQAPPRSPRTARSTGRGSLVRQAVQTLLHFPGTVARIPATEIEALGSLDEPGVEILVQLLEGVRQQPAASTAQLLERWRDHPAADRLGRLAAEASIVPDEAAALDELRTALRKLAQGAAAAELDALIAKESGNGLSPEERDRLRELLRRGPG
ncbi:MAG: DNA primase [Proteobacteria bacterium]|nr:DNA primase [Pseudomonadota bacterium]MBK9251411.1 DNA primase [Pseudomonadota bacterium]